MRWFRKFFELSRAQDGPGDFQAFALKAHQSSEAIRKLIFSVSKKMPLNNGSPPLNNTL
jgi:hypothetical protein